MAAGNEWNEKLCGCFSDMRSCLCGCFCTPCLFGLNAEKIEEGTGIFMCCFYAILTPCYLCWLPHCTKRQDLRLLYRLREYPCGDCPTTCFCSPCALCQEARFLKRQTSSISPETSSKKPVKRQPRAHH